MKQNMGTVDRVLRMVIAVALVVLFFAGAVTGTEGILLVLLAGLLALTSLSGYCPVYPLFGIDTHVLDRKAH